MTNQSLLTGIELISCAKASAASGVTVAAQNCGYGDDIELFKSALKSACTDVGVKIDGVAGLLTEQQQIAQVGGVEIAPDTTSHL